jgi:thymidylate synthase (FAD)
MREVEIDIFLIAKTGACKDEIRKWLDRVGAQEYMPPYEEAKLTDAEAVIGLSAKRCYMSFLADGKLNPNLTKVRTDWTEYIDNILKSGHGSVTECASWTFAIEGVSRVFSAEMNRHRAGVAISEGSMRYIRFTDIPFWMPTSLRVTVGDDAELTGKKLKSREIFRRAFEQMQTNYTELVKTWGLDDCATCGLTAKDHEVIAVINPAGDHKFKPKDFKEKKQITSCIRRIIGMGVATGGVWTVNLRALRHILTMRTDPSAEEEIAHVWTRIGKMMIESEPRLMGDFKLDEATGCWRPEYRKV